jgi:hypothetical protein
VSAGSTETATDTRVRVTVYEETVAGGTPPRVDRLAELLSLPAPVVRESLERLAAARALVLQPTSREILMANPFSAVATPFVVHAGGRRYYGNCVWDALGIPAMVRSDATVHTSCACCGEAMELAVAGGSLAPVEAAVHFAIPARRWWDDIVYN